MLGITASCLSGGAFNTSALGYPLWLQGEHYKEYPMRRMLCNKKARYKEAGFLFSTNTLVFSSVRNSNVCHPIRNKYMSQGFLRLV